MWKFCALHLFCWTVLFIQLNHNAYCQQAVRPTMKDVKVLKEFQKIPEFHFQNTVTPWHIVFPGIGLIDLDWLLNSST